MIARRGLLAGVLAAVAPGEVRAAPSVLRFDVVRNDSVIGHHVITFQRDAGTLVADIAVEIIVRLGPIVLFRYNHSARETWRNDQFVMLASQTNDDGKACQVRAVRSGEDIVVESLGVPRRVLPAETIPLTHWNSLCMERPLFNPQDGVPVESTVVARGEDMVALAGGRTVRAAHYSLVGKIALDDWYDDARQWTALRSIGKDGSTIEYRRES